MDIDAAARRLPEFIKTLRTNRAARRESVYASDNVYALLDALDTAEARVRELEAMLADQRTIAKYNREQAEAVERRLAEAYERAAKVAEEMPNMIAIGPKHVRGLRGSDVADAIRKMSQEVKL